LGLFVPQTNKKGPARTLLTRTTVRSGLGSRPGGAQIYDKPTSDHVPLLAARNARGQATTGSPALQKKRPAGADFGGMQALISRLMGGIFINYFTLSSPVTDIRADNSA
jgi:hypothetical protein